MKKKGFTLIELLGVIVILGVLAIIVFPLLLKQINNAKMGIKDANDVLILDAARDYVTENEKDFVKNDGNSYCVSIDTLIKENYLNPNLKDSENKEMNLNRVVEVKYNKNTFSYKIVENKTCENIDIEIADDYPDIDDDNPGIICGESFEEDYDNQTICYIRSIEDLVAFSNLANNGKNFSGKTVILENDLNFKNSGSYATIDQVEVSNMVNNLTSGNGFTPIGTTSSLTFNGTFDGNDKKIGGLYISNTTSDFMGLFGYVNSATIKDFKLDSFVVRGNNSTGGLVGYNTSGHIKNVILTNGNIYGNSNVGGIVGYNTGKLTSSTYSGNVDGNSNVALATGYNTNLTSSVIVEGNVTGTSSTGGIVGYNTKETRGIMLNGTIKCINCTANRTIGTGANSQSVTLALDTVTTNGSITTNNTEITSANGYTIVKNLLDDINTYERTIDTWIGGDTDSDGYYLDYDTDDTIKFIKTEDKPIEFTLPGSGTANDPYLIVTAEELIQVSLNSSAHYKLMGNIDFTESTFYMLSSSNYNQFTGVFDGNGYTISNASFKGSTGAGLFGDNGGTIKNLTIAELNVSGMGIIGTLVGHNTGTVLNVTDNNSKINSNYNYTGMIGYTESGLVQDIEVNNLNNNNGTGYAGGITGYIASSGIIKGIEINKLNLISSGQYAGGITGYNLGTISSSFVNNSNIQGTANVGLAAGRNSQSITSVIVSGDVTGDSYTGGIAGYNTNKMDAIFVGGNVTCTSSCYRVGSLSSTNNVNAVVAHSVTLNGNIQNEIGETNSSLGLSIENNWLVDINAYEQSIDTYIGGDNDSDGYYLDYDSNRNIKFIKTEDKPIEFTLAGSGTEEDPYQITSAQELYQVSLNPTAHYKLMNDINLEDEKAYTLGSHKTNFQGVFDGNNHTISNLTIHGSKYVGLFGITAGATIFDLNISDFNIEGSTHIGGLIGSNTESSVIKGITTSNVNSTGYKHVGVLAGYNDSTMTSSIVNGNATGDYISKINVGLAAGYNTGTIEAIVSGNVVGSSSTAGIVGYTSTNTVYGAYTSGSVTGSYRASTGTNINSLVLNTITINGVVPTTNLGLTLANGYGVPENYFSDVNTYEAIMDTKIGGDNNSDGYYLDYDDNGNIKFIKIEDKPINFTLSGSGTTDDPYLITTAEELYQVSLNLSASYSLTSNIDLTGTNQYMLSSYQYPFAGTFEGNNHTISGLDITGSFSVGLFGKNQGSIENININNFTVNGAIRTGSLVGHNNLGTVKNIKANNITVTGNDEQTGGLIGTNEAATSDNIITNGNYELQNITVTGKNYVGGAVGYNSNYNYLTNVTVNGNVSGTNYIGIGVGISNSNSSITNIIASGNVSGNSYVGGLVGAAYSQTLFTGVYKSGNVIATGNYYNRTIGYNNGTSTNYQTVANDNILVNSSTKTSSSTTSTNGADASEEQLTNLNTYELVIDTYIGGDNDADGYYFDYDSEGNITFIQVAEEEPLTGSGTAEDPYLIGNISDMKKASKNPSGHYKLTNNIDYTNANFYQLGSYKNIFTGTFDGNNHTISNINSHGSNYTGFIGYNSGTIKNLNINNINIDGKNYTAAIAGYNDGTIKGININNSTVSGFEYTSGIAGYNSDGNIQNSMINGNITGTTYVGLVSGYTNGTSIINSVVADGSVAGTRYVGGIVGYHYRGTTAGAYRSGSVIGTGSNTYRTHGYRSATTIQIIASENITVNGVVPTSYLTVEGYNGLPKTQEELLTSTPYEEVGFNFTDTDASTNEYIWYFEDDILQFKTN